MASSNRAFLLVALGAGAAYFLYGGSTGDWSMSNLLTSSWPANWLSVGQCYVPTLNQIEQQYGLPANLLCGVAYQESTFNPAAVNESSGATGMFQLLPQYYPNAGQSWQADAASAAQALSGYYNQFGNWQDALAAYDWGPGNLSKSGPTTTTCCLPTETQNYVRAIAAAVPGVCGPFFNVAT